MTKEELEKFNKEAEARMAEYPDGPWKKEPNRLEFQYEGFDCMIIRNKVGALCGYVGLKEGHPDFGKHYDEVDVRVHGGLTYGDSCGGHICHVQDDADNTRTYWLGFDCSHGGDLVPGFLKYKNELPGFRAFVTDKDNYRDIEYVKNEVKWLARQLLERSNQNGK